VLQSHDPDICGTIDDCVALLTGAVRNGRPVAPALIGARLCDHGRAGAEALVPLLAHPSQEVRRLASIALDQFDEIEPRHLPALIAAHRRGLDVAEPIARTGSDEALRYIEAGWSEGDGPNESSRVLPLFGRRAEPFLLLGWSGAAKAVRATRRSPFLARSPGSGRCRSRRGP
jgi:hypothetical protein